MGSSPISDAFFIDNSNNKFIFPKLKWFLILSCDKKEKVHENDGEYKESSVFCWENSIYLFINWFVKFTEKFEKLLPA